ncbi:MAG: prepilin-type N-terminal cleavage/methylation domain-containing protein [Planctomycetota bacterium]
MASSKRHGVTVIEMLVVIAIISIMLALIMGGVMMVRGVNMATTTNIEIREMATGLENFKAKYGVYPPSRVTLSPSSATCDAIISQMWPGINHAAAFGGLGPAPVPLTGDQCLVFFLGGVQDADGCKGFSTSSVNPFQPPALGDKERQAPFFKFKPQRLFKRPGSSFFSYGDGFYKLNVNQAEQSTYYAYFAPVKGVGYVETHCNAQGDYKGNTPKPYMDAASAYLNRQTFQILSAGKNTLWGTARRWAPGMALTDADSLDNITNFANGPLTGS